MSEIRSMDSYTEEERRLIDSAYAKNLVDLTTEETEIIIEWEKSKALESAQFESAQQLQVQESQARIAALQQEHTLAMSSMQTLVDMAIQRLNNLLSTDTIQNVENLAIGGENGEKQK